ncbi:MAG: transglycosylase SLT domain-containing protein [Spirochaetales bacterium]|nr:transglycosylase SLT domain-containing protein [Spirochaetales bacterium]
MPTEKKPPRLHHPAPIVPIAAAAMLMALLLSNRPDTAAADTAEAWVPDMYERYADLPARGMAEKLGKRDAGDRIAELYASADTRPLVNGFFAELTGSPQIAALILEEAAKREVPPALAFAVAWEESHFNPRALNRNSDSVDRGLFQLNSKSFPKLATGEFYDIPTNIRLGVAHLDFCLDKGGNEVAALAIYNAGLTRVGKGGTPRSTLDYAARIVRWRDDLEDLFEVRVIAEQAFAKAAEAEAEARRSATAARPLLAALLRSDSGVSVD